jgi:prophage antirepressor-like protein
MMEALKVFSNPQFGEIRTIIENSEPHFSAADVCRALGYANPRDAVSRHVDSDDVAKHDTIDNLGRTQQLTYINESGVYSLVFGSKLENAKQFKKWVTSEVLPSIRKHGAYATEQTIENMLANPENAIKVFTALKEERTKREIAEKAIEVQEAQLKELAPKAQYTDKVLQSTETYATTRIAQELGMSAITLNKKLHERRIQRKVDGQWVLYAQYLNEGFTKPHTVPFLKSDGTTGTNTQTVWTEKGRKFIHEIFNSIPK